MMAGKIISLILLGLGTVLLIFASTALSESFRMMREGRMVNGEVVEFDTKANGEGGSLFTPVFEFKTKEGKVVRFRSSNSSNPPAWELGDKTRIIYEARNPELAEEMTFWNLFGNAVLIGGMGLPLFIYGFGFWAFQLFLLSTRHSV